MRTHGEVLPWQIQLKKVDRCRTDWLVHDRLGMFIHWGLYPVEKWGVLSGSYQWILYEQKTANFRTLKNGILQLAKQERNYGMNNINRIISLKGILLLVLGSVACLSAGSVFGEAYLVKDGKPCADIVISEKPTRAVKLASAELQTYLEKMSGAKLAVTTSPGSDVPAHIYVGRSAETDKLKITDEGLKYGAFKVVSGENWLVLLGHDKDFVMPKYVASSYADIPRATKEWDERTGAHWSNPYFGARLYREYNATVGVSMYDERGSFNAVCEFLRNLGVRWYMPGDLGEIVPALKTISLVPVDKTVKPDFPYRNMGDYSPTFDCGTRDAVMYILRLGRDPILGIPGPHGLCNVDARPEVRKEHPEFYANHKSPAPSEVYYAHCLSSPELIAETVKYARTVFEIYPDLQFISVWPMDGFWRGNMCQCDLCKGQVTPERGAGGDMSDYVWGFVDRVARELYKTHPDRKVICGSYGGFVLPPEKISKFSPNVMVEIVQPRYSFNNPGEHAKALEIRKGFLDKLAPGNLCIYCHYLGSGSCLPSYYPHAIAEDLHSLKGLSQGEYIELSQGPNASSMHAPGFNHLNVYVTMRYYWDADQNIEVLLNEYYEKFYGPAAKEMKAFIEFSEANWTKMENDVAPIGKALELLAAARKAAGDSVYGKRIDLVVDYCQKPMTDRIAKLAKGRNKDLKFMAESCGRPPAKLDGKLDKPLWKDLPEYPLFDIKTGQAPINGVTTTFRVAWCDDEAFYFGIRCEEPDIKGLNITSREPDTTAVGEGDNIDLLFETQGHSYYQIAISPSGAVSDMDRKDNKMNFLWTSGVQAATYVGDGFWSMELRVPVAGDQAETINPLIGISGHKPTADYPWYFNLGRQRARESGRECSASAPPKKDGTGAGFHDLWNFGQLIVK